MSDPSMNTATASNTSNSSEPDDPLNDLWNAFTGVGEYAAIHAALLREAVIHALASQHEVETAKVDPVAIATTAGLPVQPSAIMAELPPASVSVAADLPTESPPDPASEPPVNNDVAGRSMAASAPAANSSAPQSAGVAHPLDPLVAVQADPTVLREPSRVAISAAPIGSVLSSGTKPIAPGNYHPELNVIAQNQTEARAALRILDTKGILLPISFETSTDAKPLWGANELSTTDAVAATRGDVPANQGQVSPYQVADRESENREFKYVVKKLGLDADQKDRLHREISKQGLDRYEIMERAIDMFGDSLK